MKYGSRKFIIAMFILIGSTALCGYGKMDGDKVMICYSLVGVGYGFANVMEQRGK